MVLGLMVKLTYWMIRFSFLSLRLAIPILVWCVRIAWRGAVLLVAAIAALIAARELAKRERLPSVEPLS